MIEAIYRHLWSTRLNERLGNGAICLKKFEYTDEVVRLADALAPVVYLTFNSNKHPPFLNNTLI